jgi:uncharacterized LabA/DUF88 family protein
MAVDYSKLANFLLLPLRKNLPIDLVRSYFYYCAPWMPENPDDEDNRRMEAHRQFVDQVESTNRWQVKLGKLERRREGRQEYFEQKRVDVLLSVDLVRHAAAGHIQHAIIVAGDSDFIPAVAAAKDSGVTVSLWTGPVKTSHRDLDWLADELHRFDGTAFRTYTNDQPLPPRPNRDQLENTGPRRRRGSRGGRGRSSSSGSSSSSRSTSKDRPRERDNDDRDRD